MNNKEEEEEEKKVEVTVQQQQQQQQQNKTDYIDNIDSNKSLINTSITTSDLCLDNNNNNNNNNKYEDDKCASDNWRNGKYKCTTLTGHGENITSILLGPSNKVISSSYDTTIKIWDIETSDCIKTLTNRNNVVMSMQLDPTNSKIICGSTTGNISIWDINNGHLDHSVKGHYAYISNIKVNYKSCIFSSGSKDKDIKIWSQTGHQKSVLKCKSAVVNLEWSESNSHHLYSTSGDTLSLWDVETGQCIKSYTSHIHVINCLSVPSKQPYPISGMIATGGEDATVKIWDTRDSTHIKSLNVGSTVYSLQYEPVLNALVTGSQDNKVRYWNVDTQQCQQVFLGHTASVNIVHLEPDRIVSASLDSNIWVFNYSSPQLINNNNNNFRNHKLSGHQHMIRCMHVDETKIISGSYDNTIRLWDFAYYQRRDNSKCRIM
eukprot:gene2151-2650_t